MYKLLFRGGPASHTLACVGRASLERQVLRILLLLNSIHPLRPASWLVFARHEFVA